MKHVFYFSLFACVLFLTGITSSFDCPNPGVQTAINGKVTDDETGEAILFADVALYKNGILVTGAQTNFDGNYSINNIDAGIYDLEASYVGYESKRIAGVRINAGEVSRVDFILGTGIDLECVTIIEYKRPLISTDNTSSGGSLTADEIRSLPTKNINDLASTSVGLRSSKNKCVGTRGSRSKGTSYVIDGIKTSGSLTKKNKSPHKPSVAVNASKATDLSGKLTATEVNDFANWTFWETIQETEFISTSLKWKMNPLERYSIHVQNNEQVALSGLSIELLSKDDHVLWSTISDNLGHAELFGSFFENQEQSPGHRIRVSKNKKELANVPAHQFNTEAQIIQVNSSCQAIEAIELAFLMDISGSMRDEMAYLRSEISSIVSRIKHEFSGRLLRVGVVYFQGHGDRTPITSMDLTDDFEALFSFIHGQYGGGGADEAIDLALQTAVEEMSWYENSSKIIFLMGDEELDNVEMNRERQRYYTKRCAEEGIKINPIGCSGMPKSLEYVMRAMAIGTGGTYIALTDDSGIGNTHIKPTTSKINVQALNDLLFDVILRFVSKRDCSDLIISESDQIKSPDGSLNRQLGKEKSEIELSLFPNPTSGIFKLTRKEVKSIEHLWITDMAGRLVRQLNPDPSDRYFDVSDLASGQYFLIYQDKKGQFGSSFLLKTGTTIARR